MNHSKCIDIMKKFLNDYSALVLDLDYTLFDEALYFKQVFKKFCTAIEVEDKYESLCEDYYSLRPKSKNIFKELLQQNNIQEDINIDLLFELFISTDCEVVLYDDVLDFIIEVKRRGVKLGLLTNGNVKAQSNKVRNLRIEKYFDTIVYARIFGSEKEKPHMSSFKHIKELLNVEDNSILFVGDNPKTDFSGAKMVGGSTIRILRGLYKEVPSNEFIDVEVNKLNDIFNL